MAHHPAVDAILNARATAAEPSTVRSPRGPARSLGYARALALRGERRRAAGGAALAHPRGGLLGGRRRPHGAEPALRSANRVRVGGPPRGRRRPAPGHARSASGGAPAARHGGRRRRPPRRPAGGGRRGDPWARRAAARRRGRDRRWLTATCPLLVDRSAGLDDVAGGEKLQEAFDAATAGAVAYAALSAHGPESARARLTRIPKALMTFNYLGRNRRGHDGGVQLDLSAGSTRPHAIDTAAWFDGGALTVALGFDGRLGRAEAEAMIEAIGGACARRAASRAAAARRLLPPRRPTPRRRDASASGSRRCRVGSTVDAHPGCSSRGLNGPASIASSSPTPWTGR